MSAVYGGIDATKLTIRNLTGHYVSPKWEGILPVYCTEKTILRVG